MRVENSYAAAVRSGEIRGNGGGSPVKVSGWTCQGFPTPTADQTGQTSKCVSGNTEIVALIQLPASSG